MWREIRSEDPMILETAIRLLTGAGKTKCQILS